MASAAETWGQTLAMLSENQAPTPKPDSFKPQIFIPDTNNPDLQDLIDFTELGQITFNRKPYDSAVTELNSLAQHYDSFFSQLSSGKEITAEELKSHLLDQLTELFPSQVYEIMQLFDEYNFIFEDTVSFAQAVIHEASLLSNPLESQKLLYYPNSAELILYVREETHELLRRSRLLGLVPFAVLDALRDLPIKVIGASVAAYTIDLLASYGAKNIEFTDAGHIDTSNGGRLVGDMPKINKLGESKALTLGEYLYSKEPYGNFTSNHGKIVPEATGAAGEKTLEEYTRGPGLVIEVIDGPHLKILFRLLMKKFETEMIKMWVADISPSPIAGIEGDKFFNQDATDEEWEALLNSIMQAPGSEQARAGALLAVTKMLQKELSEEHAMSLLMTVLGVQTFWSQAHADSRASAATAVGILLKHLHGKNMAGRNFTLGELDENGENEYRPALFILQELLNHKLHKKD